MYRNYINIIKSTVNRNYTKVKSAVDKNYTNKIKSAPYRNYTKVKSAEYRNYTTKMESTVYRNYTDKIKIWILYNKMFIIVIVYMNCFKR